MEALPVSSYLTNVLLTSSAPSTDHAVVMDLTADNSVSCAIPDTLFGGSEEWEYVVACYDGCTQPHATATTHCISQTQYEVYVVISEIGSAGSATITNSLGAPAVTAADTGTYTVGPFSINSPVDIEVEGASVLCSWTLHVSAPDCSNVGITEQEFGRLGVFPNPSDGSFSVQFPEGLKGTTELRVTDLAGRTVYQEAVRLETVAQLNLGNLPNGLYTLTAQSPGGRLISTISILH
jgi:hypothetical protein